MPWHRPIGTIHLLHPSRSVLAGKTPESYGITVRSHRNCLFVFLKKTMGQLFQVAIVHTKQLHVVNVGDADEVVWGYWGSNSAYSAYLQLPKDGSDPNH